jgi:hypothetical protein
MIRRRPASTLHCNDRQGRAKTANAIRPSAYLRTAAANTIRDRDRDAGNTETLFCGLALVTESTHGSRGSRRHTRSFHSRGIGQWWRSGDRSAVSKCCVVDRRWNAVHQVAQGDQHQGWRRLGFGLQPIQVALHELLRLISCTPGHPPLPRGSGRRRSVLRKMVCTGWELSSRTWRFGCFVGNPLCDHTIRRGI